MNISVIGPGAVGGYYGALLVRAGFEVHFLFHSDFEHVKNQGLYVESINGDIKLSRIHAHAAPEDMPVCDIAIIALKTTENHLLPDILPQVVRPDGTVVLLQNGLGAEASVQAVLPDAAVLGGLCFLCSNKIGPGRIRHLDYGSIRMAQYGPAGRAAGITPQLETVTGLFHRAGIQVGMAGDLGCARWEKLVWNMPFNGLCVILNAMTSDLVFSDPATVLLRSVMLEVIGAARSCGYGIEPEFADEMIAATRKMVSYKPSMKLDYETGRKPETGAIYRYPVEAAAAAGFNMSQCRVLLHQLEYLDRQNRNLSS